MEGFTHIRWRAATLRSAAFAAGACLVAVLTFASSAAAQALRADIIARKQDEKAASSHDYEPLKAERVFLSVKKRFIDSPGGFYPLIGSVYSGGGVAFGGGYREYYGDRTLWDLKGLWSTRNYKLAELSTDSKGHAQDRLDFSARAGWRDAPRGAYYGIGAATSTGDRASFRLKQTFAGASIKVRPLSAIALGAGLEYDNYTLESGRGNAPSVETRYTASSAPALGVSPAYLRGSLSAGVDWRPAAGYARRGGLYEVRYHSYRERAGVYGFDRVEAELVQHIPLLKETWVISLRGLVNTTLRDSDVAPYFLLPSLGGSDTLRGYPSWRFRDRHTLLLQGEYRWTPNPKVMDMALFFDAGKLAGLRSGLDLRGLKRDAGIEVRFHGPSATPLRLGLAHGTEGWCVVFGGSAAF